MTLILLVFFHVAGVDTILTNIGIAVRSKGWVLVSTLIIFYFRLFDGDIHSTASITYTWELGLNFQKFGLSEIFFKEKI